MRFPFLIIALLFLTGATYYVSPTGDDDTGDGTTGTPWLNVQTGCDALSAGDTLIVKDGTYTDAQTCHDVPGTAESPVTVRSENQYGVVFSRGMDPGEWTNSSGNIWVSGNDTAPSVSTAPALWQIGRNVGQTLETVEGNLNADNEFFYDGVNDRWKIYSTTDPNEEEWRGWSSGNTGLFVMNSQYTTFDGFKYEYNHVGMLTGTLSIECDIGTFNVTVKNSWSRFATHWGMAAGSYSGCQTHNLILEDNLIQYVHRINSNESLNNGHCFKFAANDEVAGGTGSIMRNNTVHNCSQQGIQHSVGWDTVQFYGNTIHDYGLRFSGHASAISCNWGSASLGGCDVYDNTIYGGDNPIGSGIYIQGVANDVHIYRNKIYDNDWHGIYVFNNSGNNDIWIYNNLISNNRTSGIRVEASTGNNFFFNNTLYNNGSDPAFGTGAALNLRADAADGFTFFNNIVHQIDAYALSNDAFVGAVYHDFGNIFYREDSGDVISYNGGDYTLAEYVALTAGLALPKGTRSYETNPLLTDPENDDFTLQASSPAKLHGIYYQESVLTEDYAQNNRGKLWDMGAYEQSGEILATGVVLSGVELAQ